MNILYINHYGYTPKDFYCDKKGLPKKVIGDGGSNIHLHLIEYFSLSNKITISTFKNNYQLKAFFAKNPNIIIEENKTPAYAFGKYSFTLDHLYKTIILPLLACFHPLNYDYVFSTTDFLPDALYAFILKLRNQQIKWVASYFLEAPKPWSKDNPYRKNLVHFVKGSIYWLFQLISSELINHQADYVLVTSEPDVKKFINKNRDKKKVIVVMGGVDMTSSNSYLRSGKVLSIEKRKYDACFLGRLHPQKGCLELIDIWKIVVKQKPNARLALIGNGPLEENIKKKIKEYNLEKNIDLFGFKYGKEKEAIFKNSKIILHPATYDSGGMSAAEGMAWKLPAVGFDLESLKSYYPKGMVKVPKYDLEKFTGIIISLLTNQNFYDRIAADAFNLIKKEWNWENRSASVSKQLFKS